jgi:small-conductance mechanosensitive channel
MELTPAQWTAVTRLFWTVLTLGIAFTVGHLINAIVISRMRRLAARTQGQWDDVMVEELGRRIPLWSLLIGAWISVGYWELPDRWASLSSNAIRALGVLSVTLAGSAIASRLVVSYGPRLTPGVPVSGLMRNVVTGVIVTLGLLVILHGLGVEITPMLAALGVGGLAVALALQEPLSNLFAGVFITFAGQVNIGDYVRLDNGVEGTIADFNWHSTRIQALAGHLIIVPNAKLSQAIVSNLSEPGPDLGFGVDLTVEHGSDLDAVERIALAVAREVIATVPGASSAEPGVRFNAMTDLGVRVSVGFRAKTFTDQFLLRHEIIKRLTARFAAHGIEIAAVATRSPQRPA